MPSLVVLGMRAHLMKTLLIAIPIHSNDSVYDMIWRACDNLVDQILGFYSLLDRWIVRVFLFTRADFIKTSSQHLFLNFTVIQTKQILHFSQFSAHISFFMAESSLSTVHRATKCILNKTLAHAHPPVRRTTRVRPLLPPSLPSSSVTPR
jgi:hypothetical protein